MPLISLALQFVHIMFVKIIANQSRSKVEKTKIPFCLHDILHGKVETTFIVI